MPPRTKAQIEAKICLSGRHKWIEGQRNCKACARESHRKAKRKRRLDPEYRKAENAYKRGLRKKPEVRKTESAYNYKYSLQQKYNLSIIEYNKLLEVQSGVCAICQNECVSGRRLAVDHDHETGEIRGLLCINCNKGLGHFKDDRKRLKRAFEYLGDHND